MLQHCTELDQLLGTYLDPVARQGIAEASVFAIHAHAGQTRRNGEPFVTHPLAVAGIVATWRMDAASVITALLHDVLEDTAVSAATLEDRFGKTVTTMVLALTKPKPDPGLQSRIQNPSSTMEQLLVASAREPRVLQIKLADRLHNMRTLHYLDATRQHRIARETFAHYVPLAQRIGMHEIACELQRLAETCGANSPGTSGTHPPAWDSPKTCELSLNHSLLACCS